MVDVASTCGHARKDLRWGASRTSGGVFVASEAVMIATFKAMLIPFTVVVALAGVVLVNRLRECDRTGYHL